MSGLRSRRAELSELPASLKAVRAGLGDRRPSLKAVRAGLGDRGASLEGLRAGLGSLRAGLRNLRARLEGGVRAGLASLRARLSVRSAGLNDLRADRGNAPLELVLIAPVILMVIGLVIAAGRVSTAQAAVDAAAREAARQASVATSEATAQQAAVSGALSALAADGLNCQPIVQLPNLRWAFNSTIGTSAAIRVRVICLVHLSDLLVPGVPGSIRLKAVFTSPLDPYRSRDLAASVSPQQAVNGSWPS
jgi:TadE-like protein